MYYHAIESYEDSSNELRQFMILWFSSLRILNVIAGGQEV